MLHTSKFSAHQRKITTEHRQREVNIIRKETSMIKALRDSSARNHLKLYIETSRVQHQVTLTSEIKQEREKNKRGREIGKRNSRCGHRWCGCPGERDRGGRDPRRRRTRSPWAGLWPCPSWWRRLEPRRSCRSDPWACPRWSPTRSPQWRASPRLNPSLLSVPLFKNTSFTLHSLV